MMTVLSTRLRNVKLVRSWWSAGKQKEAIDVLIDLKDPAVLIDVLVSQLALPSAPVAAHA